VRKDAAVGGAAAAVGADAVVPTRMTAVA